MTCYEHPRADVIRIDLGHSREVRWACWDKARHRDSNPSGACGLWTSEVTPSPVEKWLGVPVEKGRVKVDSHCEVPGHPGIFVVGDTAAFDIGSDKFLTGVAQVATQQGAHVGRVISSRLAGNTPPPVFRYFDKGNMAVIGKKFAILETG